MRILVAEKDPTVRALVRTRLEHRRYHVIEAETSEETLQVLDRQPVALVLLSSEMERLGGKLVIEKIRERSHLTTLPVILMVQEDQLAELLMVQKRGFDDFLIKPFNPLVLQLRVAINIVRTQERLHTNPLTHLPGTHLVERIIQKKIERNEKFSVLYIDINHFKSFNDLYGFEKGDKVIRQTAKILVQTANRLLSEGQCFIGHIGGDDFIVVLDPDYEESFARTFIREFDRISRTYYNETHQKEGCVRVINRRGKRESLPLMSCSVAACNNLHRSYKSLGEIARDAAEVKAFLKSQPGSHYLRDRRNEPFQRLEEAAQLLKVEINAKSPSRKKASLQMHPLGKILVDAGLIEQEALEAALKRHLETGERLGQALIAMNLVKSEDVGRMLEKKLNIPYINLKQLNVRREVLRLFTLQFMKAHRVVPIETTRGGLKLAMCDPFDLRTLDAIERITGLKPIPCVALEDEFEEFIEKRAGEGLCQEKTG